MSQNPTENLRRGRRRIEEIPEIILLKDWTWDVVTKRFYLHIRVCLDHDGKDIPRVTEWFVTAETVYPFGTLSTIWKSICTVMFKSGCTSSNRMPCVSTRF